MKTPKGFGFEMWECSDCGNRGPGAMPELQKHWEECEPYQAKKAVAETRGEMTQPTEPKLLPCPFCGGDAFISDRNRPLHHGGMGTNGPAWRTIGCQKCGYYMCADHYKGPGSEKQVIEAWNTRSTRLTPEQWAKVRWFNLGDYGDDDKEQVDFANAAINYALQDLKPEEEE